MRIPQSGLRIDSPAFPLLQAHITYWGITDAAGNALGTTMVDSRCSALTQQPSYAGHVVKILDGPSAGQIRTIMVHTLATGTLTVAAAFTDSTGAVQQIAANIRYVILSIGGGFEWLIAVLSGNITDLPYLMETWQDVLGIDVTVWTTVVGGAGPGTVARSVAEEPYQKVIIAGAGNANDTARLHTVQEWQVAPDTYGLNTIVKRLPMEWEGRFVDVASIDAAAFIMGLTQNALDTAASANIAGFCIVAGALNAITNDGTGPTVTPIPSAPNLLLWHKYRIVVYAGTIEFWVDEVLEVTHTTAAGQDLPDVNAHGQFYVPQVALGAGTGELHVAPVSIKPQALF